MCVIITEKCALVLCVFAGIFFVVVWKGGRGGIIANVLKSDRHLNELLCRCDEIITAR